MAATSSALSASELKNCADMMVEKPFFIRNALLSLVALRRGLRRAPCLQKGQRFIARTPCAIGTRDAGCVQAAESSVEPLVRRSVACRVRSKR